MKKVTKIISSVAVLGLLLMPVVASAQLNLGNQTLNNVSGNVGYNTGQQLPETIGNIIKVIIGLIGLIALVIFIAGGFLWMTAGGDEDQIKKAKSLMKNAVIGIAIVVLAYAATSFIIGRLITVSQ